MEIAIIGGGIAGLSTALALHREGIPATVFERANRLNEVGAGIWLQPNALKVLKTLGLKESIVKSGVELDRVDITNAQLNSFKSGGNAVQDNEGNKIISIHRAKLQKILFDALPEKMVNLGFDFQSIEAQTDKIQIDFGGKKVSVDYLLGADGINSRIRKSLFPKSTLRHSGQTCWRGIATIRLADDLQRLGREAWGNTVRFGFSQISDEAVYWFAVAKAKHFEQDNKAKLKDDLLHMFRSFHPLVGQIIDQTNVHEIIRGDILDLRRLDNWHHGKICLLGDAAHATTPNMGQGAGQAIEDAFVIAKLFSQDLPSEEMFSQFENLRREKVDYVVNNSWRFGQMAHSGLGSFLMKTIMKLTPASVITKQLDKLYRVPTI